MKNTFFIFLLFTSFLQANVIEVGPNKPIKSVNKAIQLANVNDTVVVFNGLYRESTIIIDKKIVFIGKNSPVLDGQKKYEVISVKADGVIIKGFKIIRSGHGSLVEPCGIKVYSCKNVVIQNNILDDNFFGIYIQNGKNCIIKNNKIIAYAKEEQEIGNGIHCWKSSNIQITSNYISGHRDGIYFEFVTNSVVRKNVSIHNSRYGLHFMFSNDDSYISNVFKNNGAGVAVMYTHRVKMYYNHFIENWGDSAYGLLLKEITDSYIIGNHFNENTSGIHMEGITRTLVEKNVFKANGWAMNIQASCMDNVIKKNNFLGNTFDISTNGSLVMNTFNSNYWDKYEGYDLNKDGVGDVPYHPLSLFAVLTERNPSTMLLFRSFMITLLDKSEKILPSITPDNFIDKTPLMHPMSL